MAAQLWLPKKNWPLGLGCLAHSLVSLRNPAPSDHLIRRAAKAGKKTPIHTWSRNGKYSACWPISISFRLQHDSNTIRMSYFLYNIAIIWATSSEFGTYHLYEQRRFRGACASMQSCQNLRCSLIQAVSQEEPSDRKPDPWPLWMAGHAQLKFVMTECSKTKICLTWPIWYWSALIPLSLFPIVRHWPIMHCFAL